LGEVVPQRGLGAVAPAAASPLLIQAAWPQPQPALEAPELRALFADLQEVTRAVRDIRASTGTAPRAPLTVTLKAAPERLAVLEPHVHVVQRLAIAGALRCDPTATRPAGAAARLVTGLQVFVHDVIDDAAERDRLERELGRVAKEIKSCESKLGNPKFTARAPEAVVAEERRRLAEYQTSREALARDLAELAG
jgi:valyl-tRNA synthetase